MVNLTIKEFIECLGSDAPVPGGGGASALLGAVSSALCSMVASLTSGKKKYAAYQQDIERILQETAALTQKMEFLIRRDAEAFAPLSKAYGIPKEDPRREQILEDALRTACASALAILREVCKVVPLLEELEVKGSRLALSDVGVSAAACVAAIRGAALNIYINTKLMRERTYAERVNAEAGRLCEAHIFRCEAVYEAVAAALTGGVRS